MLGEHKGQEIVSQDTIELVWEAFWFLAAREDFVLCFGHDLSIAPTEEMS